MTETTKLTADEEAKLRKRLRWTQAMIPNGEAVRLFATLDAARSRLDPAIVLQACKNVNGDDPDNPEGWGDFAIEFAAEYDRLAAADGLEEAIG